MAANQSFTYKKKNSVLVTEIHSNLTQEIIEITEDRTRIILINHISCVEKNNKWQTPLALLITILIVLTTTNFKKSFGLSENTWEAIFIIASILCSIWFIKTLIEYQRNLTIDIVIDKLKNK